MKNKYPFLLLIVVTFVLLSGCKKDPDPASSGYYIKYNLAGQSYHNKSQVFAAGSEFANEVGGWCNSETNYYNSAAITIYFVNDIVKTDVLALSGKTFYFDGTSNAGIAMDRIEFKHNIGLNYIYSYETTDHSYFVKINSVTFVENNGMFNIYKVTGTFKAKMEYDNTNPSIFKDATGGEFNMMWSSFH